MGLLDVFKSTAAAETREALIPDPPWRAKTVVAAGMATLAGLAGYVSDLASPALARFGGSYIAGFFIGWAFRRFVKLMVVLGALAIAGIALLKNAGWWTTDWTALERQVTQNVEAVQRGTEGFKQFLTGYLPSAGAAAGGVFLGFRKK